MDEKTIARFWAKVDKRADDECWNWTGALRNRRYGGFHFKNKDVMAHRFSYELHAGCSLSTEFSVCHRCDNTRCVNPRHLFAGTHADNMRDMAAKGRTGIHIGSDNVNAKLNEDSVRAIRSLAANGAAQRVIAARFGVHQALVWNVVHRRIWKHVA